MNKSKPYSGELNPWQPAHLLRSYSLQEIRFSSGYLLGNYKKRFKSALASWLPVFDLAQTTLEKVETTPGFQFPGDLDFLYVFKKGEEFGLIGIDGQSFRSIATLFLESELFSDLSGEFVVEYLARKLLFTFTKSLEEGRESEVTFHGLTDVGEIDIEGHLEVKLDFGGKNISLHLGFGPDVLQQLDLALKEESQIPKSKREKNHLVRIGIPINSEAAKYLELGQAVLLEQALVDPLCAILPDGRSIQGRLGQFNQRFAFESMGVLDGVQDASNFLELAQAEVEIVESLFNVGLIFLSKTIVSKNATLVRDTTLIADLTIYTADDRFVFKKT